MADSTIGGTPSRAATGPTGSDVPTLVQPTLAQVYEAEFDYVFRCLRALGVPADHTDDALQDVFMVVQDKLSDFDGRCRLRTWLYAIALRVARRYRSRAAKDIQRFSAEVDIDLEVNTHGSKGDALAAQDLLGEAHRAMAAMEPSKREVFVLAHVEEFSAKEIAEVLRVPVNTVYSRIRAARAAFAAEVQKLQSRALRRHA